MPEKKLEKAKNQHYALQEILGEYLAENPRTPVDAMAVKDLAEWSYRRCWGE